MTNAASRYARLSRRQLAVVVPELLLCGHLIDRSGMAWVLDAVGRDGMVRTAIGEWSAASPVYTKRMQRALGFEGDDVVTIFKGLQFDIGAPPQFMDFRFRVNGPHDGEFWLDHCGALLDVEPMGREFVVGMCHDIEDPTFDATAMATNPRARFRPVHRPPRVPADRSPHCHWTVRIDERNSPTAPSPLTEEMAGTRAATLELDPIDPSDDGLSGYAGPLLSDVDFGAFSHSALVRIADEVCLQHHLLNLGYLRCLDGLDELTAQQRHDIAVRQLTGIAGLTAERLHRAMGEEPSPEGAMRLMQVHPLVNPARYVEADLADRTIRVRRSEAHADGAWISLCGPREPQPLAAIVQAVDARFDVEVEGTEDDWRATVVVARHPAPERLEVQVTRFSAGARFAFEPRVSIPLSVAGGRDPSGADRGVR